MRRQLVSSHASISLVLLSTACSDGGSSSDTEDAGSNQRLCLPGEELDNRGRCRCVGDSAAEDL